VSGNTCGHSHLSPCPSSAMTRADLRIGPPMQALLAAFAQHSAQQGGLPLDQITLTFKTDEVPSQASSPVGEEDQIGFHGLVLEGARLAGGVLQLPGEGDQPTPVLFRVVAVPRSERRAEAEGVYPCPVYSAVGNERSLLGWSRLLTGQQPIKYWEKRQVAIVCRSSLIDSDVSVLKAAPDRDSA
jgi:hypothetical protein